MKVKRKYEYLNPQCRNKMQHLCFVRKIKIGFYTKNSSIKKGCVIHFTCGPDGFISK